MNLKQCDRCMAVEIAEADYQALSYIAPDSLYIVKAYGRDQYGNLRPTDFCRKCQELANEVMSRFMKATLKEEVDGRNNAGADGQLGQEA